MPGCRRSRGGRRAGWRQGGAVGPYSHDVAMSGPTPSNEARRRFQRVIGATFVSTMIVIAGCTSTTDESGAEVDGEQLSPTLYPSTMNEICATTTERLRSLPSPPDEISRADWAGEVSLALRDEAESFEAIDVGSELGADHRALVANTKQQAEQWSALETALGEASQSEASQREASQSEASQSEASESSVAGSIGDITTEIGQLTLGRDDLTAEMGLSGCGSREIGR